ncbi:hypothetical protein KZZ52_28640 [Dactylosporangium sp. AC04546]|uniref:CG0192-related protein n=1 Tax=Dactylosporangium sp. AC04546 TaxID=2862460 RepID=UPI001EDFC4D9|nr:hypothetical protein [Dactylosporangium sp. AC04546]WVK89238.1 hypothetical protein KZZ52_28640 [Dactylosporangium sp. AC04546]
MALLHQAEITPSKLELIEAWLPDQSWFQEPSAEGLARVAAYRFDDPDGEVGIEALLVRIGAGPVYQVPLTYRGAPLGGADAWLVGTTEHSVLGKRWVYAACGDPVYAAVLADALFGTAGQADEYLEVDGQPVLRKPLMTVTTTRAGGRTDAPGDATATAGTVRGVVRGVVSGDPTVIETDLGTLAVVHVLGATPQPDADAVLTGQRDGIDGPLLLAYASRA